MVTGLLHGPTSKKITSNAKEKKSKPLVIPMIGEKLQVRKDLGVFVDVGIPDKEIVVSLDVLPELRVA